ncbi:MAG: diguanylate cyclase [Gammaproteobacteria bacterium]
MRPELLHVPDPARRESARVRWRSILSLPPALSPMERTLAQERVRELVAQEPFVIGGGLVAALIYFAGVQARSPAFDLLLWLAAYCATLVARAWSVAAYRRDPAPDPLGWALRFCALIGASGAAWGTALVLACSSGDRVVAGITLLWICGLTAAATSAYAILIEACAGYMVLGTLLPAFWLGATGTTWERTMGIGLLVFGVFVMMFAARASMRHTRLQVLQAENRELIAELNTEKAYVEELNELLRADILRQDKAAEDLRRSKEAAEELARRLAILSSLDGLTEIANRRQFEETLAREWARGRRDGTPLALILCDIDHFKLFNDHYGHQAGDDCLKRIAPILKRYCRRGGDLAARYGGEEFALLLPTTDIDSAARLAEAIRAEIRALAIPHAQSRNAAVVTASLGVSSIIPQPDIRPDTLVGTADKALYEAKRTGRDRIATAAPFNDGP